MQTAQGLPVVLVGDYTWGTFSGEDYDFNAMFDTLRANGLNFARVWLWWGCEEFPERYDGVHLSAYQRTGPGTANDGKPKYDLAKFNPEFFLRLRNVCKGAMGRGVFLQLTIFDAWMVKHEELWRLHAYQRDNNIEGVDGDPNRTGKGTNGERGFCSMSNPKVLDAQKALVCEVIDTVNEFDNIFFEIANENYYNAEWERGLCEFIHEYEKTKPKRHLVMPLDLPNHDYGGVKTWDTQRLHVAMVKGRALNQPLIFDSDGIGSPEDAVVRKAAWTAFVSGGHVDYLDPSLQVGALHKGDFSGSRRRSLRRQLGYLAGLTKQVRFWEMQPGDAMVRAGEAFVFGSPGEIVAYLPKGGKATLDLGGFQGSLAARWFDPRKGEWGKAFEARTAQECEFWAPSQDDWVLHLRKGGEVP